MTNKIGGKSVGFKPGKTITRSHSKSRTKVVPIGDIKDLHPTCSECKDWVRFLYEDGECPVLGIDSEEDFYCRDWEGKGF